MFPANTLVSDMVVKTWWGTRRTRFYWACDPVPTGISDLEAIGNKLMDTIGDGWKDFMSSINQILRFEQRWYGTGTTGFEGNSTASAVVGNIVAVTPGSVTDESDAGAADTLPDEVSLIVQKRTGNWGRQQNGRWFFTGMHENLNNAGQIDIEALAGAKTFANSLSDDITVTAGFACTLHARHYNQKDNILMPITKCYAIRTLGTRKDRRAPLRLERA